MASASARIRPGQMLPAAGQGALGIEVRATAGHDRRPGAAGPHAHLAAVTAERAVSRCMGGSCSMPLAAHGRFDDGTLRWMPPGAISKAAGPGARAPAARHHAARPSPGRAVAAQLQAQGARCAASTAEARGPPHPDPPLPEALRGSNCCRRRLDAAAATIPAPIRWPHCSAWAGTGGLPGRDVCQRQCGARPFGRPRPA
jgi:hypothetical protein